MTYVSVVNYLKLKEGGVGISSSFRWWAKIVLVVTLGATFLLPVVTDKVKNRNARGEYERASHVMQYSDVLSLRDEKNFTYHIQFFYSNDYWTSVSQTDADLVHFLAVIRSAKEGSDEKREAEHKLSEALAHRRHVDESMDLVGKLLFGIEAGPKVLTEQTTQVDDFHCVKMMVQIFESHCGSLSTYGLKHIQSFDNICSTGVEIDKMAKVSALACNARVFRRTLIALSTRDSVCSDHIVSLLLNGLLKIFHEWMT